MAIGTATWHASDSLSFYATGKAIHFDGRTHSVLTVGVNFPL